MPVRTFNDNQYNTGLPHDLKLNGFDPEKEPEEIEKMGRGMAFVDVQTAIHHRIVTRDPICGVGNLPKEINPLEGHRLRGSSENTKLGRDPILLKGDLGAEYNCLYTLKDLHCKDREDRNIITLDGQLGEELDPLRPHGGRPRNFIQQEELRNPITGQGEFRKEWDPIWKYEGRHNIKRPEQKKRDPVTHSVPAENMGNCGEKHYLRRFNNHKNTDFISHEHPNEENGTDLAKSEFQTGIRHFPTKEYRDPITHENKLGEPEEKSWRPGTKHFPERIMVDDPIQHHGLSDDYVDMAKKRQEAQDKSLNRIVRDPISGEGIVQKECKSLWNVSNDYVFRSFLNPKHNNAKEKPDSKPKQKPKSIKKK